MTDSKLLQLKSIKLAQKKASVDDQFLGDPKNDKEMRKLATGIDGENNVDFISYDKFQGNNKVNEEAQEDSLEVKSLDAINNIIEIVDQIDLDSESDKVDWSTVYSHLNKVIDLLSEFEDKNVNESRDKIFFF